MLDSALASFLTEALFLIMWVLLFVVLKSGAESFWLFWKRQKFALAIPYVLLELKIPREILKSPKAMEQILNAIAGLRNAPGNFKEKYLDGEITRSFSLEIVSFEGEVHFYMRIPTAFRSIIEGAFFSYYPDVEIEEVKDYIDRLPENVADATDRSVTISGTEIVLAKEAAYPIRSYIEFESPDEDKQYDPIGTMLEAFGKLKAGEIGCLQIVITPKALDEWKSDWSEFLKDLKEKKDSKPASQGLKVEFPEGGPLPAFIIPEEKKEETPRLIQRTPGEVRVIEMIENNLAKPAFDSIFRFIYVGAQGSPNENSIIFGIMSALNQYQGLHLNSFKPNAKTFTKTSIWKKPYLFPAKRTEYLKERILYNYRIRETPMDTFAGKLLTSFIFNWNIHSKIATLNTESLATIFHPPTRIVLTAPHIARVESRKSGAPAGMAVYGDEADIEKFK